MARLHGTDRHVTDGLARGRLPRQQLALQVGHDQLKGRVGEELAVRDAADQLDPVLGQATTEDLGQVRVRIHLDLVDDRPQHLDPVLLEEGGVEHDLVDRAADTPFADDDHLAPQQGGHRRVGHPDHRADPGVPGALDHDKVLPGGDASEGALHLPGQVVADAAHDEVRREVPGQGHRAHVVQRVRQIEDLAHQDGILVGARAVDHQVALPHRLQEAKPMTGAHDPGDQPQRGGGLAAVLSGCRQKDSARAGSSRPVTPWPWRAVRRAPRPRAGGSPARGPPSPARGAPRAVRGGRRQGSAGHPRPR